ncbi:hypothetical protein NP493_153g00000 [Ridgeia piscesae]|uniref:Uncharacterized protein n=1 Tax=Ridgeia piscesae TaxID=27915 RepID=A0AAD9P4E2_RIDPI|nr:hypothetical protein NP493_153g00000 [Ridgeia piscesae]
MFDCMAVDSFFGTTISYLTTMLPELKVTPSTSYFPGPSVTSSTRFNSSTTVVFNSLYFSEDLSVRSYENALSSSFTETVRRALSESGNVSKKPVIQLFPVKLPTHLHVLFFPVSVHVPPFLHGDVRHSGP